MFYHTRGEFRTAYAANRKAKHDLVNMGRAHGTMVYCGADPVGWCQFGPKEELPRIDTMRGYKPTSDNPWRITCLFVASRHRRLGVARFAVQESLLAMKKLGAKVVEAYPVEGESAARSLWTGTPHLFEAEGFSRIGPVGRKSWIYSKNLSEP